MLKMSKHSEVDQQATPSDFGDVDARVARGDGHIRAERVLPGIIVGR
jgi:hypothetical protein